ncbi:hypothetical protein [Pararhodospirillum oryzae]|uniref:DUF4276 family protein n=1 Tax=Pararhodospirillum oryzae TaxID=478448 RepID=A0A512HAS9_9PROT|nr:hypothetical protein [Pararhodospirillum oryzae]GEO82563.1 hypothetical protein ROR02_26940 [Pararhodospirillum oryzae]
MHLEILVEDQSGKIALETIIPKIVGPQGTPHTWKITAYKGIGGLPKDLGKQKDPRKRILLDRLPALLRGYGKAFRGYPALVIVVCDLDRRDESAFRAELEAVWQDCDPHPPTLFCLAIEEGEAWLLGDREAVLAAYPEARTGVLDAYQQDSVCGTWELLADAIHPGGAAALKRLGFPPTGEAKCAWARTIPPHMDMDRNRSPSFCRFRDGIRHSLPGDP